MAETRGGYRAVKVVLLDGPDYQDLSERARHVFLVLKLSFGPTGIEVHYRDALLAEVAEKTGIPSDVVAEVMDELRAEGWVDWERNVVWILGQLKHEPHFNAQNAKHRTAVWSHVGGLPRLKIVSRFVMAYPEYFEGAPDSLCDSLPDSPCDSPSNGYGIAPRSREKGVGNRDEGGGSNRTSAKALDSKLSTREDRMQTVDVTDGEEWRWLKGELCPAVREHVWRGRKPPDRVPSNGQTWDEARELSYVREWIRSGLMEPGEAEDFLRLAPVEMGWKQAASLSWIGKEEDLPRVQEIVGRVRKQTMQALGDLL